MSVNAVHLLMHASPYPSITSVSNGITEQYPEMPSSPEMHAHCQKLWTHNIRVVWGHSFNWSNEQCRPTYSPTNTKPWAFSPILLLGY